MKTTSLRKPTKEQIIASLLHTLALECDTDDLREVIKELEYIVYTRENIPF